MSLTKADIVNGISVISISDHRRFSNTQSSELRMSEAIKMTFISGENVLISGFGKFCVKNKNPGGKNTPTGEDHILKAGLSIQMLPVPNGNLNGKS